MSTTDLIITGRKVIHRGGVSPAAIHIKNGRITTVTNQPPEHPDCPIMDAGDKLVMPGIVDCHVHINEPGRTEWEGFTTATKAAAAGGITSVVDMPLNCDPVTTTMAALETKRSAISGKTWVDHTFWGGVIPGNQNELEDMIRAGLPGFKCFLVHSGIDDFPNVIESDLKIAMPILAKHGSKLLVHAELAGPIAAAESAQKGPLNSYASFLKSRPRAAENEAIDLVIKLCRETGCPIHIVHLSSSDALPALAKARAEGLPVTVETCPHYLTFAAEDIPDGATHFKCCPPIREQENREKLWSGLKDGIIDIVVSDHSPCPPSMKCLEAGDFFQAWGGISALQLSLPLVWTSARKRGCEMKDLVRWMCQGPAELIGLGDRKGRLAAGYDADIVVFDPDASLIPKPDMIQHRHKLTPAEGCHLTGVVEKTYLRGQLVYENSRVSSSPLGICLKGQP
jgi:allantoinase